MLPSFRLIAVTFLCGFLVVFAGLRLATSLNDIHEALPVMAAHAAPVSITPIADRDARRGLASVPVMYDLRFAVSSVSPTLVRVAPTIMERPALPSSVAPHEGEAEQSKASSRLESTFAAIPSGPPAITAPAVSPGEAAEPAKPETPAVAAIDPQIEPVPATIAPAAEIPAAAAKAEAIETRAATPSEETAEPLQAEPDSTAAIETPATASPDSPTMPLPESRAATAPDSATAAENGSSSPEAAAIAPAPAPKAKIVRKRSVRTAHRPAPVNSFGTFSNPPSNPFGAQ